MNEEENEYLWKSDEELDDVGDEPRDVADEKDADDDGGGARDAHGAGVRDAALPAHHVAAEPRGAGRLVAPELAVDERVEDGQHADGGDEVHEEVEEVDVHLRRVILQVSVTTTDTCAKCREPSLLSDTTLDAICSYSCSNGGIQISDVSLRPAKNAFNRRAPTVLTKGTLN